ncbi:hypothetical protein EI94DRAFT_1700769 [Lactarius quietus]|nr:hypothetical protein EI94DRAFT_1700769 [Lactarius quietus]
MVYCGTTVQDLWYNMSYYATVIKSDTVHNDALSPSLSPSPPPHPGPVVRVVIAAIVPPSSSVVIAIFIVITVAIVVVEVVVGNGWDRGSGWPGYWWYAFGSHAP